MNSFIEMQLPDEQKKYIDDAIQNGYTSWINLLVHELHDENEFLDLEPGKTYIKDPFWRSNPDIARMRILSYIGKAIVEYAQENQDAAVNFFTNLIVGYPGKVDIANLDTTQNLSILDSAEEAGVTDLADRIRTYGGDVKRLYAPLAMHLDISRTYFYAWFARQDNSKDPVGELKETIELVREATNTEANINNIVAGAMAYALYIENDEALCKRIMDLIDWADFSDQDIADLRKLQETQADAHNYVMAATLRDFIDGIVDMRSRVHATMGQQNTPSEAPASLQQ